jgi:hypothetical protein
VIDPLPSTSSRRKDSSSEWKAEKSLVEIASVMASIHTRSDVRIAMR